MTGAGPDRDRVGVRGEGRLRRGCLLAGLVWALLGALVVLGWWVLGW